MKADIRFENYGPVALIRPLTPKGQKWVSKNLSAESWQKIDGAIAAEPFMTLAITVGAQEDGLRLEGEARVPAILCNLG